MNLAVDHPPESVDFEQVCRDLLAYSEEEGYWVDPEDKPDHGAAAIAAGIPVSMDIII